MYLCLLFCFYDQKQLGDKRFYFCLQVIIHHWEKPRQELKAGSWKQELKQRPWSSAALLAGFPWLIQLSFLYSPGLPAQRWLCPHWIKSSYINLYVRKCLQRHDHSWVLSWDSLFPCMSVFVSLTCTLHKAIYDRCIYNCRNFLRICKTETGEPVEVNGPSSLVHAAANSIIVLV